MKPIEPGQGVAVFRLPMPLNGVELLNDALQRIYGTGEWMLQFNGDQIQANAPKEGFGPPKRSRRRLAAVDTDDKIAHQLVQDGRVDMTVETAQDTVATVMALTQLWFDAMGGINYVEFGLQGPDGEPQPFVFCVQRRDGKSPHTLREEAEAEVERLRAEVERLSQQIGGGS